ncbi:MAG: bifunctional UDP-sugar hydrolase/5'-nucleotidase [Gemmiger sp.]|uniref:bifunctional metallophosphatase/5'-nucleotidase n=1 Tax=Gemmiger sp. TaxID=2049027 RepID=UPI002E78994F|nr:bifunctional UDP-sugar hydrolase/5'-nucleotidase [Gemmiger sp.]MEE1422042.1 bifunctional UDP-sugar hydrolase/5'-nucleotidase [Gemmiger sp.]
MRKECTALALAGVLLLAAVPSAWPACAQEAAPGTAVDIVFTHDTHSHLNTFTTMVDGLETELGGFARMNTLIEAQRTQNPDTLVIDGGDFSMGTLIQTVFETQAAELRMLGYLGCDVTTLGNHEFDYRSKGLANMLTSAQASGDAVPAMVVCNVDWDTMEAEGLTEGQQRLKDAFAAYGVSDYTVLEKGDVDIAVVGVFGKDALACAPTCELKFEDPIEAVKQTVADIKANEDVDMIVCVSHSGTWEDESKSEDELLAKAVPDLDLILSGHTHTEIEKPIQHGSTYVVSCGEYGKNLGELTLTQQADGRWAMSAYELIPITSDIAVHAATQQTIDSFMDTVDTDYLARFGYTKDQVLAENDIVFSTQKDLENIHEEHNLGDIIADAYVYAVENAADYDGVPVDLAVVPSGTVRDTYARGDITVEQVFNSFSLGIGADGVPGYPLISVYLTGREIRTAAEIDASVSDFMTTARLYCSGLNFTYNPHRLLLNKVTDVCLEDDGQRVALEDDKLYRIVADLYSGQMLSAVTDMSYGILSIVPKYADGTPITDFEDVIITENGRELKAWDSIARYMASFADTDGDGIANVPAYYSTTHGRKLVDTSRSPLALLKNPNKFTAVYAGLLAAAVLLIVLVVLLIRKLVKKARRRAA